MKTVWPKTGISKKRKKALLQGFKEMKLAEAGKLKMRFAAELLKELKREIVY